MKLLMLIFSITSILFLVNCNEGGRQHESLNEGGAHSESRESTRDPNSIGIHEVARLPDLQQPQPPQMMSIQELSARYDEMLLQKPTPVVHMEYDCQKDKSTINITVQEYEGEPGKGELLCDYKHNGQLWYYANNQRNFCQTQLQHQVQALINDGYSCEEKQNEPKVADGNNDSQESQELAKTEGEAAPPESGSTDSDGGEGQKEENTESETHGGNEGQEPQAPEAAETQTEENPPSTD